MCGSGETVRRRAAELLVTVSRSAGTSSTNSESGAGRVIPP